MELSHFRIWIVGDAAAADNVFVVVILKRYDVSFEPLTRVKLVQLTLDDSMIVVKNYMYNNFISGKLLTMFYIESVLETQLS